MKLYLLPLLALLVTLWVSGCSFLAENDQRVDYKKSTHIDPLILPPDLSASLDEELVVPGSGTTTYSDYNRVESGRISQRQNKSVLPQLAGMRFRSENEMRWLEINMPPETLWPKLVQYWENEGFTLKVKDPRIGLIETEWAENRADIPQDFIRRLLGRALDGIYSAATRDKYRMRLERGGETEQTRLYIAHRGALEIEQNDSFVWQFRPSDPNLEAEMLNRMLVYLGLAQEQAAQVTAQEETVQRVEKVIRDGQSTLLVDESFAPAWQRLGIALDRAGFTVQDRDRDAGFYFVRYTEDAAEQKHSFWSNLAFWKDHPQNELQEFRVHLQQAGEQSEVRLEDVDGIIHNA